MQGLLRQVGSTMAFFWKMQDIKTATRNMSSRLYVDEKAGIRRDAINHGIQPMAAAVFRQVRLCG